MLPGPERLHAIATGPSGSLEEVPYAVLLAALALEKRSCLVLLRRKQTEKRIFLSAGVPVESLSNLVHETFGRFLVGQGKLSEEEFGLAFAQANAKGLRLGEVLVERGTFPKPEIARLLQQNLARKLLDGFTWNDGTYEIHPDPPTIDSPPRVNVAQLIITGASKFAPQAAVDAAVGSLVGKRLALHPDPPFPLEEVHLSEAQLRLTKALEKRPRIDELALSAGMPFEELTRVLYALWLLRTVVPADELPAVPRPVSAVSPAVAAPAAAPSPRPPPGPTSAALRREDLRIVHDMLQNLDAFDLLGLPDGADEATVKSRFVEKAREWAPWNFEGPEGDAGRALTLFLAAARAYAEIADPRSREALRRSRRVTGQAVKSPEQYLTIKMEVLDPEVQHRKGMELLESGNAKEALASLELAAECDRQNGTWAADMAWCRFLASDRAHPSAALAAMEEAIRIDPQAGIACFYAGEILRSRGDSAHAEVHYRKAARLMVGDRRALDALKEMTRVSNR